jgi:chemotaxis protein methyltransferase WspC
VKAVGPSAEAYYLWGLVRDAAGDEAAMDYYRKALYLEPNHYETLLQMALLLERNGDRAAARAFKRRAERLQQKTE